MKKVACPLFPLPDGAETMQDKLLVEKLGIGALSTGSAKQTGSTITQVAGIERVNSP